VKEGARGEGLGGGGDGKGVGGEREWVEYG